MNYENLIVHMVNEKRHSTILLNARDNGRGDLLLLCSCFPLCRGHDDAAYIIVEMSTHFSKSN